MPGYRLQILGMEFREIFHSLICNVSVRFFANEADVQCPLGTEIESMLCSHSDLGKS